MTTHHDDNGDYALMPGNDPLDSLLRDWHAENAASAAAQRDQLMQAVAANAKSRLGEHLESDSGRRNSSSPTEGGRYALSLKGEGAKATRFARFTPAIAASLAFAATLGLLFSTAGPRNEARADVIMAPDGGRLDAVNARGELIGPCPLKHTDVHVDVSGSFARVTLQQRYGNPYADKIEAVYTFPLSHRAAVDRMTMTIGDRIVVGEVKEREAARATYEAAKSAGHAAALLEQERPNIFTQSVANIEPGVEIVVEISYVELLEARDGLFGFTFPMVVAPRYIPGGDDSSKALPAGLQHREGLNLLAPGTLTITANGDTSQIGALTAEVIYALITDAVPIEAPPAEYWASHYPTTGQPAVWHQFEVGYMDGQREAAVLYTDGLGQINGRWFYIDAGSAPKPATGIGFASGTAQVPDAARITPQPVKPTTRAGHDISITVNIDTGGPGITDLKSELHGIQQNWGGMRTDGAPSQVAVSLNDVATIPNQDFVLHWRQTADTITEQVFTHAGAHGGFITLILNPPARVENTQAVPRELVFVLDTSGSMQGFPIQKAKEVMSKAIAALRPQDTFNLITFAGDTNILWDTPQPASPDKLAEAQQFLDSREGRGGTEMMNAINAALTVKPEQRQLAEGRATPVRIVCFMTDGEVGNDMQIIDAVRKNAATTRVFSFGIGNSVNRYLLDGIAKAGRGAAEFVLLSEGADEKVASFSQRIQSPVLMDVRMDFAGDIEIVDGVSNGIDATVEAGNSSSPTEGGRYAMQLPDLYDVAPVIVHARYTKGGMGSMTLRGNAGDGPYEKTIELVLPEAKAEHDVIATLWAREKVEQIMNRDLAPAQAGNFPDELKRQVIDLGETFQIMTQYTSFVAVENLRVTVGGQPRLVPVPIELPEGQSWEGTMGEAVNKWADEVAPKDLVGRTADMWSLVRANNTTPKQFSVPSQTDTPDPAQDTTVYYDFLTEVHLSYCYQYQSNPNHPILGSGSDPTFPLMADANPYVNHGNIAATDDVIATKLQQPMGEINLDGVPIGQAIDHLRDLSGVNIVVDWNALENAAIGKDKEVSLRINAGTVKMETVLKLILGEVGGGEMELASQVGDGVVQISTKEMLENRITTQAYNVQDLIRRVEEIESNAAIDSTAQAQATSEQELLWQQAEKTYRVTEEKIKQAVIDYNFAEARQLMDLSEQTLEANRPYAADAMRYQQFRDHAVQLRRYIDDEEDATNAESEIAAAGNEIVSREQQRLSVIGGSKREQIDRLMGHAIELRKERRYDDAAEVLGQTLAIDPANQRAATMKETLEDISAKSQERASASAQRYEALDALVTSEEASIPWHKDVLYPKNWAEISAKRDSATAGREGANAHVFGMVAGQPGQPQPAQTRGRELILGQPVTTTAQPAQVGEVQAGFTVNRYGLADSLAPTGSTQSFTRSQPVIAATEGRQAGTVMRVPVVGFIAPPPVDPAAAADETLRRSLDTSAGRSMIRSTAPMPFARPGLIPTAQPQTSSEGFQAWHNVQSSLYDVNNSAALGIVTLPDSGGTAGAIQPYDADGDGVPDMQMGTSGSSAGANATNDGWDAGQPKSSVLGDFPGVGDAFRITGRGVTLGMPEPHSPEAETTPGAASTKLPHASMTPQKAAELIAALQKKQSTIAPESATVRLELEKKNKELQDFRATWSVLGQGTEPNEKLMTLESVVTELELDSLGKQALLDQLQNMTPESMPVSPELQVLLANDPKLARYKADLQQVEENLRLAKQQYGDKHRVVIQYEHQREASKRRLDEETAVKTLTINNQQISQAQQSYLRSQDMLLKANDQLAKIKSEQRDKDAKMAEYQQLVSERDALSTRLEQSTSGDSSNHTNRAGQDVQFKDGHVDFEQSAVGVLLEHGNAADVAQVRPSMRRPGDTVADRMLLDQLLVRTATLARAGRMDASMAVVEAILKARPAPSPLEAEGDQGGSPKGRVSIGDSPGRGEGVFAVARAMHDVLSSGVLTVDSIIARVSELAAGPAKRLAASAERARLMARRLDERLLRLAVGDASAEATAGLDTTDAGVLVSVLVDAFGDGTVADLTKSSLKIESTSKPTRVVIGRIAVKRLADLAMCKHVRRIEAVKVR